MELLLDRIRELVVPLLESENKVLVDLKYYRGRRRLSLTFLIDRPEGGISVAECAELNQKIGSMFDEENLIQEPYVLDKILGSDRRKIIPNEEKKELRDILIEILKKV